jgi:hypothetical protein
MEQVEGGARPRTYVKQTMIWRKGDAAASRRADARGAAKRCSRVGWGAHPHNLLPHRPAVVLPRMGRRSGSTRRRSTTATRAVAARCADGWRRRSQQTPAVQERAGAVSARPRSTFLARTRGDAFAATRQRRSGSRPCSRGRGSAARRPSSRKFRIQQHSSARVAGGGGPPGGGGAPRVYLQLQNRHQGRFLIV